MKDLCIVIGECRFDWLIVAESPHVADKVCKLFVQFVGHVTLASYNIVPCSQDNFFPIIFDLRLGHSDLV